MKDKTIIVTGAAKGIGLAITKLLICQDCKVLACDKDTAALENLSTQYSDEQLQCFEVDVAEPKQVEHFFKEIVSLESRPFGLVNNAGIYLGRNLFEYKLDEIDSVINTNIKGAVYFSKHFGQLLKDSQSNGAIVNISSVSGQEGSSDAIYGMSKAAIIGLTKSCAMLFAPNIRVNAVAPTLVETPLIANVPKWRLEEYREHEMIKSPVEPEDVANTVEFLLSDKSRNYTGAVFDINNGCFLR